MSRILAIRGEGEGDRVEPVRQQVEALVSLGYEYPIDPVILNEATKLHESLERHNFGRVQAVLKTELQDAQGNYTGIPATKVLLAEMKDFSEAIILPGEYTLKQAAEALGKKIVGGCKFNPKKRAKNKAEKR